MELLMFINTIVRLDDSVMIFFDILVGVIFWDKIIGNLFGF